MTPEKTPVSAVMNRRPARLERGILYFIILFTFIVVSSSLSISKVTKIIPARQDFAFPTAI